MGPTILFTHLKIILLQCFQFSVFSNNKLNPNGPINVFSSSTPSLPINLIKNTVLNMLGKREGFFFFFFSMEERRIVEFAICLIHVQGKQV